MTARVPGLARAAPLPPHPRATPGASIVLPSIKSTRVPRTWAIHGNDQVCVKLPWDHPCFRTQRHKTKPGVYRMINVKNDIATVITVEDGTPQF
jgi:hypothetical protein